MSEQNVKRNKTLHVILRFVISFGLMGVILYSFRAQLPTVFQYLKEVKPAYFIVAVAAFFVGLLAVAYRLRFVIQVHGTKLSVGAAYYVNLIALFLIMSCRHPWVVKW